jgi:hypothetical protein
LPKPRVELTPVDPTDPQFARRQKVRKVYTVRIGKNRKPGARGARRYTLRQKGMAVGLAAVNGSTAASQMTGIPVETISTWYRSGRYAQLREVTAEDVAKSMWVGIQIGVEEVVKGIQSPKAPLREKTDATAMLLERHALMTGGATARYETNDITGQFNDHEKAQLRDALDKLAAEESPDVAQLTDGMVEASFVEVPVEEPEVPVEE